MKPRRRFPRKIHLLLIGLVLIIVLAVGALYVAWQKTRSSTKPPEQFAAKYISLGGGYLFSIPAKYTVDETIIAGMSIIYPEASPPQAGRSLEQLYENGTLAAQPIAALKDSNDKAFKEYINNVLAVDLGKAMGSATDVREAKHGGVEAFKIFAQTNTGKRLRVIYAINLSQPIVIVAKEESDILKVVAGSMEDLKKQSFKSDIDQVVQATRTQVEMIQKQDATGIRSKASAEFNKKTPEDKLTADLVAAAAYLKRAVIIAGGSYDGKDFIAQLIFEPKTKDETSASGVVSMRKQGKNWELEGLQLPK